jgi:hypothetical protein
MTDLEVQPLGQHRHPGAGPLLSGKSPNKAGQVVAGIGRRGYIPERQLNNDQTRNMFRISRIQELLKPIARGQFDRLASVHRSDRYAKRFKSWDQLTAMVYAQLSGAQGLRQLEAGFNAQRAHHCHLGTRELRRSSPHPL